MTQSSDLIIRLALKDEGVREALKATGKDGERALKKLDSAQKEISPGMRALNNAGEELQSRFDGLKNRAGPLGRIVGGLGPIFSIAAVGVGALAAGLAAANAAGAKAITTLVDVAREADRAGLSLQDYSAFRYAFAGMNVPIEEGASAIATFNKNTSEAAQETGEFYSALRFLNPEMVSTVQKTDSLDGRLEAVRKAYNAATSEAQKHTIVVRAFGESGAAAGKRILESTQSVSEMYTDASRAGVIYSQTMIEAAREADAEIAQANQRIEASMTLLGFHFKDVTVSMKTAWADLIGTIADIKPLTAAEERLEQIARKRARQEGIIFANSGPRSLGGRASAQQDFIVLQAEARVEALNKEEQAIRRKMAAEELDRQNDLIFGPAGIASTAGKSAEELNPRELSTSDLAFVNRTREEALSLDEQRSKALDILTRARRDGIITSEEEYQSLRAIIIERYKDRDAIAAQARAEKEKQRAIAAIQREMDRGRDQLIADLLREEADATNELARAYQQTLTPVQAYAAETERLIALREKANIPEAEFNDILAFRAQRLRELQDAERQAAERKRYGETLENARKRIVDSLRTDEEVIQAKLDAEKAVLDALVSSGQLSQTQALEYMKKYEEQLRKTGESATALTNILNSQIRTVEDLGKAILNELVRSLLKTAQAKDGLTKDGFFGRFIDTVKKDFGFGGDDKSTPGIFTFGANDNDGGQEVSALSRAAAKAAQTITSRLDPSLIETSLKTVRDTTVTQTATTARAREVQMINQVTRALEKFKRELNEGTGEGGGGGSDIFALASSFFSGGGSQSSSPAALDALINSNSAALSAAPAPAPSGFSGKSVSSAANINLKVVRDDNTKITVSESKRGGESEIIVMAKSVARSEAAQYLNDGSADRGLTGRFSLSRKPTQR